MAKTSKQKDSSSRTSPQGRNQHPSYHTDGSESSRESWNSQSDIRSTPICSFCGESGHVQTNGPAGTKLIQYFVCQKFTEMSPLQRFQTLKSKGFCFQCLFPGSDMSKGKHKDGRCQRDFVCQHSSHDRYTR